jgi:hypothetical protein
MADTAARYDLMLKRVQRVSAIVDGTHLGMYAYGIHFVAARQLDTSSSNGEAHKFLYKSFVRDEDVPAPAMLINYRPWVIGCIDHIGAVSGTKEVSV